MKYKGGSRAEDNVKLLRRLSMSEDGKKFLKLLKDECDPPKLFDEDPYKLAFNVGKRSVYQYVSQLIKQGEREEYDHG